MKRYRLVLAGVSFAVSAVSADDVVVDPFANPVAAECNKKDPACLARRSRDFILALPLEERRRFFERINDARPSDQANDFNEVVRAARRCDQIKNAGYMDESRWVVRCSDGRSYVIDFGNDPIIPGLDCFFFQQFGGLSCDAPTWVLGEEVVTVGASP